MKMTRLTAASLLLIRSCWKPRLRGDHDRRDVLGAVAGRRHRLVVQYHQGLRSHRDAIEN